MSCLGCFKASTECWCAWVALGEQQATHAFSVPPLLGAVQMPWQGRLQAQDGVRQHAECHWHEGWLSREVATAQSPLYTHMTGNELCECSCMDAMDKAQRGRSLEEVHCIHAGCDAGAPRQGLGRQAGAHVDPAQHLRTGSTQSSSCPLCVRSVRRHTTTLQRSDHIATIVHTLLPIAPTTA
jgi:hypothetical protein